MNLLHYAVLFYCNRRCLRLNSGPQAYMASTSPTELSLQSPSFSHGFILFLLSFLSLVSFLPHFSFSLTQARLASDLSCSSSRPLFLVVLPLPPKCWSLGCTPPHLSNSVLQIFILTHRKPEIVFMWFKTSITFEKNLSLYTFSLSLLSTY